MPSFIRDPRDFWSGVIFVAFGLGAMLVGRGYAMGTAERMGPGYFPTVLGGLLAVLGAICVLRSLVRPGEGVGRFALKNLALILGATVLFGVLIRTAGLVIAIVLLVLAGGLASSQFRLAPYLKLGIGMAIGSVLIFTKGLGLPMPAFGTWFGF